MGIINKNLKMLNFILCVKEKIKMVLKFGLLISEKSEIQNSG